MIKAVTWEKVFFFVLFLVGFLISEGDSGVMLKRKKESGICPATKKKKRALKESTKCAEVKQKTRLKY